MPPSQRLPVPEINDELIPMIYLSPCSYEQVLAFNWTILQLSEQIIVANRREALIDCVDHSSKLNEGKYGLRQVLQKYSL
jgi:hypothetical protein